MGRALTKAGVSLKGVSLVSRAAYTEENIKRTTDFLLLRTTIPRDRVMFIDEFWHRPGLAGAYHGYAATSRRAVDVDILRKSGEGRMYIAAMHQDGVPDLTMAVPTVNTYIFIWWIIHCVIPYMLASGKDILVLDNATSHPKELLHAVLGQYGLNVLFLPVHSPWYNAVRARHHIHLHRADALIW